MTYIALLRGINVSGQKSIKMELLRETFAALGCENVQTYVQSGNVVFSGDENTLAAWASQIRARIKKDFGMDVFVLVKEPRELAQIIAKNPFKKFDQANIYVSLFSSAPTKGAVKSLNDIDTGKDQIKIVAARAYLYCPNGYGRTKLNNNVLERKLGVQATTRNWKTLNALHSLVGAIPS